MSDAMAKILRRDGTDDPVHQRLRKAIEKRERAYLWVPADTISFVPRLLPTIYGDGRALYALATTNQRPRYWVIRCCSTWDSDVGEGHAEIEFGEMTDEILTDLECAFGNGRCGYSGNSLFWPRKERILDCQCEDCSNEYVARWPEVDGTGGCSWSRYNWPQDFPTVPNPLCSRTNLLDGAEHNGAPGHD